ncbi:MAG TPA: hypothetical protein VFL82_08290, partial [Thermomicrobiales bacterium]|nr:hypothetical protein [Thermomicrobiales bacterium]
MGSMVLTRLRRIILRFGRLTPMVAALLIAGSASAVLAYVVLPANQRSDPAPEAPPGTVLAAPTRFVESA